MRAASAGKTMYVVPYLMAVPGTPLAPFAAGVQLTDALWADVRNELAGG